MAFDPTEITGFAAAFQFFVHLAADTTATQPHWTTVAGYDAGETQLLGHIDGDWKAKTIADWLKLLEGYDAGKDQSIGHDAGGDPEWQDDTDECPEE